MASNDASEKMPRRVPRKRASSTRTKTTRTPSKPRAPRKTAIKKTTSKDSVRSATPAPTRKAPTSIAASRAASKAKRNQFIVFFTILIVGIGVSAAVGYTDKGVIDVNEAIEARNERIRAGQGGQGADGTQSVVVPVQNTNRQADGGLRGLGVGSAPRQPSPTPVTASSTATSSEAISTSTAETNGDTEFESIVGAPEGSEDPDIAVVESDESTEDAEPTPEVEGVSTSTILGGGR